MGNVSIIISTDAEIMFQKVASNHKGPSHFQTFIGKEMSVDLSVAVPNNKGHISQGNQYNIFTDT